jgi:hypothetical protein
MEFLNLFFFLLIAHWIGDFVLQSDWMAQNKSKEWRALAIHTLTYSTVMTLGFAVGTIALNLVVPFFLYSLGFFFLVTFATHGATDYVTSRVNAFFWRKGDIHNFFVGVGFDQVIHYYTLILTMLWLV